MSRVANEVRTEQRKRNGIIGHSFDFVLNLIVVLIIALLTSILLECLGMTFWWPEEGVLHSERMLKQEISYIAEDFQRPVTFANASASEVTVSVANKTYDILVVQSGLIDLMRFLEFPDSVNDSTVVTYARSAYRHTRDYITAAITITQVFMVRSAIIALSSPLFVLIGFATGIDGLVQRELRKMGGGREYALVYHQIKSWFKPIMFVPIFLYLASPWPTHPNWIFVPSAFAFGLLVFLLTSTFKKYL